MRSVLILMVAVMAAVAFVPLLEAAETSGNQIWVMDNGTVVAKLSAIDMVNREFTVESGRMFCRPRQPDAPAQPAPPAYEPPAFQLPNDLGDSIDAASSGPDLLQVILTIAGGAIGFIIGRKQAEDDDDEDAPEKTEPAAPMPDAVV